MSSFNKNSITWAGGGFTLIEAMVATILVGMAITALMMSSGMFTKVNGAGINLSTAEFLIEEIREFTVALPVVDPESGETTFGVESGEAGVADYDDVDDFDNSSFSPPVDINGQALNNFAAFTQQVIVQNVSETNLETVVGDHSTDFVRVTVTILLNGNEINSASWIRTR